MEPFLGNHRDQHTNCRLSQRTIYPVYPQHVNKERICPKSYSLQQGFLLSTFKWILYHFFFLGRSLVVDFFSLTSPSSLASLKEPLILLLLVLRFIGGTVVYDACISFLCLRSSSICKTNSQQDRKTSSVIMWNYHLISESGLEHKVFTS